MAEAVNVESLNIQVSAKTERAVSAFSQLTKTLQDVSTKTEASTSTFAKLAQTLQDVGTKLATASSSFVGLSETLQEVGAKIESLTSSIKEQSATTAKNTGETQRVTKEVTKLSTAASKASSGLGKLANSFKRIILYRSIRSIIKNISSAIREGLSNLKEYSAAVGTAFSPAVDSLRQHVLMLKNSFATALRPVLEAIIPIVIRLCDWLSKLADFIAQVFSVLTGKLDANGRYTKAVLGDLQQSNKEAKALRRTLLGFDEINRLDGEKDSGSSSTNAGTMFEQAEVSEEAKKWAERIKKVLDLIKEIIDKVKQFIKENPWILKLAGIILACALGFKLWEKYLKPVFDLIGKFGGKLVVIALIIAAFAAWGDKIKEWCAKAKEKVDAFFENLKEKYPELAGIIEFVQSVFDFVLETIGLLAGAIHKFAHGDFEGGVNDILEIGKKIFENPAVPLFLLLLKPVFGVLKNIFGVIGKILTPVIGFVKTVLPNLISGIKSFFSTIGVGGTIILAIIAVFSLWGDKIQDFCKNAREKIDNFLQPMRDASPILNGILGLIQGVLDFILNTIGTIAGMVYKLVHGDFKGAFNDFLELLKGIVNFVIDVVGGVINFVLGIVSECLNAILFGVRAVYNDSIRPVVNWIATFFAKAKVTVHNAVINVKIGVLKFAQFLLDRFSETFGWLFDKFNEFTAWINKVFGTDIDPITIDVVSDAIDAKIQELEATKLDPITETVDFLPKWENPTQLKLGVDTSGIKAALWGVEQEANRIGEKLTRLNAGKRALQWNENQVLTYATGGFPSVGTVFVAGESGAEYVGTINGQTGVWNSDQLINGMYQAFSSALANNPQGGGDIYLDGEVIYRNTVRRNNNRVRATGRSALLT